MSVKKYDGESATLSWTDADGKKHEVKGLASHVQIDVAKGECLAPPKWRGSDGRCNSCLVCAPEKFSKVKP